MNNKKYDISSFDQLSSTSLELLNLSDNRIFVLYGDLGVGKTTLIKYMCYHLKVIDSVSSPTFSIVNEYVNAMHEKLFHFDFYRLNNLEEFYKLGLESYFESGAYCFIEWPNIMKSLLPDKHHVFELKETMNKRELYLLK